MPRHQNFADFIHALGDDLQRPLPGKPAQFQMAPQPRANAEAHYQPAKDARQSGVLILFYPVDSSVGAFKESAIYFPLILRPTYPGVHSGQVGLPGGGYEPGDGDLVQTALRETHEEIGVAPEAVHVLGQLSWIYIQPSNNLVQPVVGWMDHRPTFRPDPREVAKLIEAPLQELLDPDKRRIENWTLHNRPATVPIFGVQDQVIWGATAMILGELLALPALQQATRKAQA